MKKNKKTSSLIRKMALTKTFLDAKKAISTPSIKENIGNILDINSYPLETMVSAETKTLPLSKEIVPEDILGVDLPFSLYDISDMFYQYYRYHNNDSIFDSVNSLSRDMFSNKLTTAPRSYSRFDTLRKIEAIRLSARPYSTRDKIAVNRPNVSMGYLRLLLDYLKLPYKALFTDSDLVKVRLNKILYNDEHLSDKEKEEVRLQSANNPNISSNKEISDDISDALAHVFSISKKIQQCIDYMPMSMVQNGFAALLHSDLDWTVTPIKALDLIFEPKASYDTSTWNMFFVIKRMNVYEIKKIIQDEEDNKESFWNTDALRWAMENSIANRGLLTNMHYGSYTNINNNESCGENTQVRSFYSEFSDRIRNLSSYHGTLLVVEGYVTNMDGKVDKCIFFPSIDFINISKNKQLGSKEKPLSLEDEFRQKANILFFRKDVFDSIDKAITILPADRSEMSLERQRGFAHELVNPVEMIMRLDCAILNFALLMGTPFIRNRTQGNDAQNLEELEIAQNGEMVDLGDRDFVENAFSADLQGMMGVRNMLMQQAMSKAFLGGLDGQETLASGRGANLANLRLVRDGRIHKHNVEDFSKGLTEAYTKIFAKILNMSDKDLNDDIIIQKLFFDTLTNIFGYPKEIFEFKESEVIPDTGLPYWMEITAIRNGASHFGAAEMVLYSEIKQVFGDGLDQKSLAALNRMGIKSMLGSQDALDILGDPKDNLVTSQDQIYRATMEDTAMLGSVDSGALSFEAIPILPDKDDHVIHLKNVHNVKCNEIIQQLKNSDVTPEVLATMSEAQLDTRNNMILKLGSLSSHIAGHLAELDKYGAKRPDINQLKEETNSILQTTEGLMNSLQISLRALKTKQDETALKMQNISPENEAEKMKQQTEMLKIQTKQEEIKGKLALANKMADLSQQQHMDNQLSKFKDREAKIVMAERDRQAKLQEKQMDLQIKKAQEAKNTQKIKK